MYLFVFEFLGTTELLVILVVALIIFGPRKLPQLSRSLGKSLTEFRRASEDFKRTWEREVAMEEVGSKSDESTPNVMPPTIAASEFSIGRDQGTALAAPVSESLTPVAAPDTVASTTEELLPAPLAEKHSSETPSLAKRDWL